MTDQPLPDIRPDVPHGARIWNYWLGGTDNYAVDRDFADAVSAVFPEIVDMAFESRRSLTRAVRFLAGEAGIRQFLDIGTGLPTTQNTHEVAQQVAPEAKIVYVDDDPLVLAHARALLVNTTPEGVTEYALRTVDEIRGWFAGTELVEPGVVPVTRWRPENGEVGQAEHIDAYCGVGRKP